MDNFIGITPAQEAFLQSSIPSFSRETWNIELAGRAGSQRYFVRVFRTIPSYESYILVVWDSRDEDWERFLSIQADVSKEISVLPVVYAHDERHGIILEEDLGTKTLKQYVVDRKDRNEVCSIYRKVLDALFQWQNLDPSLSPTIQSRVLDEDVFLWETSYFARHCVTEFCGCEELLGSAWEQERKRLALRVASLPKRCVHRDFQSENILIHDNSVRFVDFQGARLGPSEYDTASLLFDPYIAFLDTNTTEQLFDYCRKQFSDSFITETSFYQCAAQRLMQALGAYGNLSIHMGKPWYREYIPIAMDRLRSVLSYLSDFPSILRVAQGCCNALSIPEP